MTASATVGRIHEAEAEEIRQVDRAVESLKDISGLCVYHETARGTVTLVAGDPIEADVDLSEVAWRLSCDGGAYIPLGGGGKLLVQDNTEGHFCVRAAEATILATLRLIEVEKSEERLLEELSASWESLEAHYEISTDVLRSRDIDETLKRLIDRLVSIRSNLQAALFKIRDGSLEPLVSTQGNAEKTSLAELGPVERVVRERRTMVMTQPPGLASSTVCWRNAHVLAAAPITSKQDTTAFLIVWSEEPEFEFDSAFLRLLEAIAYQASILMERDRLNRQVRENELLAKEVEIASFIQQTLLLANTPKNVPGIEVAACSLPSQYIDGDFHDFFQHPDGTLDIIVGDVMGKGVAAALLGAATKNQLVRSIANLALRSTSGPPLPEDIVRRAASRISEQLISLERFVTMCYARFDMLANLMHLVDCGHTSTIFSRKSEPCIFLQSDDLPLGVLKPYECTQHSFSFKPGDTYLFYSDGVTENRSADGEFFGTERLAECVQQWSSLGPKLLVQQIHKEAHRFSGAPNFSDDFTCIAVRITRRPDSEETIRRTTATMPAETEELSKFRAWLRDALAPGDACLGEAETARLELACSELFVNFARHKEQIHCSEPIRLESSHYPDHVTIRMKHKGPVFDPLSVLPPAFDGSKESGFGTYIVLRCADEAKYERDSDGTNVITVSFLRKEGPGPNANTN